MFMTESPEGFYNSNLKQVLDWLKSNMVIQKCILKQTLMEPRQNKEVSYMQNPNLVLMFNCMTDININNFFQSIIKVLSFVLLLCCGNFIKYYSCSVRLNNFLILNNLLDGMSLFAVLYQSQ